MRTIEDIYYGGLDVHRSQRHYAARLEKLQTLASKAEYDLTATMTERQSEQLTKYKAAASELHELNECIAFENGFCLGVKLMAEVMQTRDVPSVDD